MSFHPFLAVLVEAAAITVDGADVVAMAIQTLGDWRATHPLWWDTWLFATRSSS
jgi:hypothetical protein